MTRLEELKAVLEAAEAASKSAYYVAHDATTKEAEQAYWDAFYDVDYARIVARDAYEAELAKSKENSDDH